tara:strand:+ start:49 stop:975 length:927 start_codon:yes stop_codon:yes gene_type:complete
MQHTPNIVQLNNTRSPMERLRENAVLLSVEVHLPSFKKTDKRASADHSRSRNAKVGRHKIEKVLIDSPLLKAISSLGNEARNIVKAECAPYDHGRYLCPNYKYIDVKEAVRKVFDEMQVNKDKFVAEWPMILTNNQLEMGDDHDPSEYPSLQQIKDKISWSLTPHPVPLQGDFRSQIEQDGLDEMTEDFHRATDNALRDSLEHVFKHVRRTIENVSEQLSDRDINPDAKRKFKSSCRGFHETLLDNVMRYVNMLDVCNIYDNPEVKASQQQIRDLLTSVSVPQLKASDTLRHETKQQVDEIIKNLPTL